MRLNLNESAKPTSTPDTPLHPTRASNGRRGVSLWVGVLVIVVVVGVWTAWNAYVSYNNVIQQEYRLLEVRARQHEARVSGALRSVNLIMGSIIDDLNERPGMSVADESKLLKGYLRLLPEIRSLLITDATGRIRVHTNEKAVGFDAANREYFKVHKAEPANDDFHISLPFKTVTDIVATTESRVIRDKRGQFAGVVAATLESSFFDEALKLNVVETGIQSVLINLNGDILNIVPSLGVIGKNLQGGIAYTEHIQSGQPTTRHRNKVKLEQVVKMSIFHNVPNSPLAVIVSRNYDSVISEWRRTMYSHLAGFLLLTATTIFCFRLSGRRQSALVQAQQQIAERELELRTIIETEPECVKQLAEDGTLLHMNQAGLAMIEADSLEKVLGQNICQFILPEYRDDFMALTRKVFAGESGILLFEVQGAKGGRRWLETHAVPLRNSQNQIITLLGITRDVTEHKKAEENRLRMEKQLLHAQKMESLGVLAGGIAHDFNNILTSVLGNTELALMRIDSNSPVADHLRRIEQSSLRAADLAKQMLAYSGKGRFVLDSLDINHLVEETVNSLEASLSGSTIRLNLTRPLKPVLADANQIRQVIVNLAINAAEAIGDSRGVITITTAQAMYDSGSLQDLWINTGLPANTYVSIEVSDTGCGMDTETVARIFDPFFTTKFTGRGLGMAAVLGIVRGHKGTINVKSEVGKGTTFTVLLPASTETATVVEYVETPVASTHDTRTVLLVDDEESVRDLGSQMLKMLGYDAITASNGLEAVELYKRHSNTISFVILDLTMPIMDGEQVYSQLRAVNPSVKVIISSGYSEHDVANLFTGKGIAGVLQKPFTSSNLSNAIKLLT